MSVRRSRVKRLNHEGLDLSLVGPNLENKNRIGLFGVLSICVRILHI